MDNKRISLLVGAAVFFGGIGYLYKEKIELFFSETAGSQSVKEEVVNKEGDVLRNDPKNHVFTNINEDYCVKVHAWGRPHYITNKDVQERLLALCRDTFMVSYDPDRKIPMWTHIGFKKRDVEAFTVPDNLAPSYDPTLPYSMQSNRDDIISAGYVPSYMFSLNDVYRQYGNLTQDKKEIKNNTMFEKALYQTNVIPLTKEAHNMKRAIESEFTRLGTSDDRATYYVLSGVIFLNNQHIGVIGERKAFIPTHFYKVFIDRSRLSSVAYIVPNTTNLGPLNSYRVSIADVERIAEIKFLDGMTDVQSKKLRGK